MDMLPSKRYLNGLEKWIKGNLTKFRKKEVLSPLPGKEKPHPPIQIGVKMAGKQLCGGELGVPMDNKLTTSQQCILVAKKTFGNH